MVTQGWLTPAERAAEQFPHPVRAGDHRRRARRRPAATVSAVIAELEASASPSRTSPAGLRIITTIDPARQQQPSTPSPTRSTASPKPAQRVVAIDPKTGGVLAYYGGDNGLGLDYARVERLAGSTFKPFVVLAGLQHDPPIGLGEMFSGEPLPGLRNADGADCTKCDLKQAMTISNNVVFNALAQKVGPQNVANAARAAGITSPLDNPTSGIALGNKEITTVRPRVGVRDDRRGRRVAPAAPRVVGDDRRRPGALPGPDRREQRFPERVARNVTEAMLDVAPADGSPSRRTARRGQDRHGAVALRGPEQRCVDGRVHPVRRDVVWMGTD